MPGKKNIRFVDALERFKIRFIISVRHEQGASFMAEMYGRVTGKAGLCATTLGPGGFCFPLFSRVFPWGISIRVETCGK